MVMWSYNSFKITKQNLEPERTSMTVMLCFLLLGQQVVSQHFILKVVILRPLLGSRLWSLHLRPQRVHVERVCTWATELTVR